MANELCGVAGDDLVAADDAAPGGFGEGELVPDR